MCAYRVLFLHVTVLMVSIVLQIQSWQCFTLASVYIDCIYPLTTSQIFLHTHGSTTAILSILLIWLYIYKNRYKYVVFLEWKRIYTDFFIVCLCVLPLEIKISRRERVGISLTSLTPPHFCACPMPGPD